MKIQSWVLAVMALVVASSVAQASETANWSGWHAGAYGGYLLGKINSNDPGHAQTTGNYKDDGVTAGISAGYRHQSPSHTVIGVDLIVPLYVFKGSAVDNVYFPGQIKYEAKSKYGAFVAARVGRAMGKSLPYLFAAVGFANVEGRTLNVDENDQLSIGFVQKAAATHFIWQGGGGIDCKMGENMYVGARIAAFMGARADHTMPWNTPGPNNFGYRAALLQLNVGRNV